MNATIQKGISKSKTLLRRSPSLLWCGRSCYNAFNTFWAFRLKVVYQVLSFTHLILGVKRSRLNVGSGRRRWPGWICLDEIVERGVTGIKFTESVNFPIDSGSIQLAYSSHFLEHVSDEVASRVLSEIWRCLTPDGVVFIKIHNFDLFVQAYFEGDRSYFENIGVHSV